MAITVRANGNQVYRSLVGGEVELDKALLSFDVAHRTMFCGAPAPHPAEYIRRELEKVKRYCIKCGPEGRRTTVLIIEVS